MLVRKGFIVSLIAACLLAFLLPLAMLFSQQRSLLYFPGAMPVRDALEKLASFEKIAVPTEDGLVLQAYFKAPQAGKGVILLFHGNASHPAYAREKMDGLVNQGYGVLLATYRGYAGNPSSPTEKMLFSDARSYLAWLSTRTEYAKNPRIYYGESLGSGVVVDLATEAPPAALILEAPFLSALDAARLHYSFVPFLDTLMLDQYRSDLKIEKIKAPVLFLLAWKDEVVGFAGGQKLADLANEPKRVEVFPYAYHNDIYSYDAETRVADFLKEVLP